MASYTCLAKKCRPVYFAFRGKSSVKPMWELMFEFIHKNTFYQRGTADSSIIPSTLGNFIFLFHLFQQPPEHQLPGEEHISDSD